MDADRNLAALLHFDFMLFYLLGSGVHMGQRYCHSLCQHAGNCAIYLHQSVTTGEALGGSLWQNPAVLTVDNSSGELLIWGQPGERRVASATCAHCLRYLELYSQELKALFLPMSSVTPRF